MRIADVMTREVKVIGPERSVREAARLMDDLNVGPLPVCDGERLVGMITDRDITTRATAAGQDPKTTPVSEAMSKDVFYLYEDQDVREAAKLMSDKQIRRLPVISRDKRLVGIVSLGDLATDTKDDRMKGETLERVSGPAKPDR